MQGAMPRPGHQLANKTWCNKPAAVPMPMCESCGAPAMTYTTALGDEAGRSLIKYISTLCVSCAREVT